MLSGRIIEVRRIDFDYRGFMHHASAHDPQYEIRSDDTEHITMHKGSELHRID